MICARPDCPIERTAKALDDIIREGEKRGAKVIAFKKRRRKHYRRRNGHRQDLTSVTIREILG